MAVFLFYPRLPDGACLTFVAANLANDAAALRHAVLVLEDHGSAEAVAVWRGERRVGAARRPHPARPARGAILLLEDCFFQAQTFALALREAGFAVICASGEDDALAKLKPGVPDLAVVDINLGQGPSYAVAEALAARDTPFLFVTGYDRAVLPARWRGIDHVGKPATGSHVVKAVERLLEKSRTSAAAPRLRRAPIPLTV